MLEFFANASDLTSVAQRYRGFRAASQNVVNGRFLARKLVHIPTSSRRQAPSTHRPFMTRRQANYALLRNIEKMGRHSASGRDAQSFFAQERVFSRRQRSASMHRWQQARATTVINMAAQQPKLIKAADPDNRLRSAIKADRKPTPRGPALRPHDIVQDGPRMLSPLSEIKVIPLKELPDRPTIKMMGRALSKTTIAATAPAPV